MAQSTQEHPTEAQLEAFALGTLDPVSQSEVERHIETCDHCCRRLRGVPDDTFVGRFKLADTAVGSETAGAPVGDDSAPPELVDHPRYQVFKRLGGGGMGSVFAANHRLMRRDVAIKVINSSLLKNKTAVDRFAIEMRAAAKLSHPNIVNAFDADEADGLHFLVMEYVDGINLAEKVQQDGPLPVAEACDYARQVALGLGHAHEHEMIHRDIKPKNLMLTGESNVKILDFGLARFAREPDIDPDGATAEQGITVTGIAIGTPDYLAPEQIIDARRADIRSDIYSLGCTLYFLLTGRPPHPDGSSIEKLSAHLERKPQCVGEVRGDIPQALRDVIAKMMDRDPTQRFQTPNEVAEALEPFTQTSALPLIRTHEPPRTTKIHKQARPVVPRRLLVGGIAVGALLAVAALFFGRGANPPLSQLAGEQHGDIRLTSGGVIMTPHSRTSLCGDGRGPMVFEDVEGDFMLTANVDTAGANHDGPPEHPMNLAGMLVTEAGASHESPDKPPYKLACVGRLGNGRVGINILDSESINRSIEGNHRTQLRIARLDDQLYVLDRAEGGDWTELQRWNVTDDSVRLALVAAAYDHEADLRATFSKISLETPTGKGDLFE